MTVSVNARLPPCERTLTEKVCMVNGLEEAFYRTVNRNNVTVWPEYINV